MAIPRLVSKVTAGDVRYSPNPARWDVRAPASDSIIGIIDERGSLTRRGHGALLASVPGTVSPVLPEETLWRPPWVLPWVL